MIYSHAVQFFILTVLSAANDRSVLRSNCYEVLFVFKPFDIYSKYTDDQRVSLHTHVKKMAVKTSNKKTLMISLRVSTEIKHVQGESCGCLSKLHNIGSSFCLN